MRLHPDDHAAARAYEDTHLRGFPRLSPDQRARIRARARSYRAWYRAHPALHNLVSVCLLAGLFAGDALAVLALPGLLPWSRRGLGGVAAGLVAGAAHGFALCSIGTFSVHEGATHDLIIQGRGRVARALRLLANNACRVCLADPIHYAEGHGAHHRWFGTAEDPSFTSHIRLRRLLGALAPLSPFLSRSDFIPWRPQALTRSRMLSAALTGLYLAILAALSWRRFGPVVALVAVAGFGPWFAVLLDRLRESTEHVFLPLDRDHGARDLGLGFWGLLVGGGPWGQPCHLVHHLEPSLPWYQQIGLHLHLGRVLTREQRRRFFLRPVVGLPALLWRIATQHRAPRAPRGCSS